MKRLLLFLLLLAAGSVAQNYTPAPIWVPQFFTLGGIPCSGCKIYTYQAGTTNLQSTYADAAHLTVNPNPIQLNAAGYNQTGTGGIFLQPLAYKICLRTSLDATVTPCQDNVTSWNGSISVGLSLPASLFTVSGSPVTSSGTLTGTFVNFAAHNWLGNNTGVSALPVPSQPACADLSNGAASCSTDTTNATNISSGTLASARLSTNVVRTDQVNTAAAAMTLDLSASTVANAFKAPVQAGLTSGADGAEGYDSTNKNWHLRVNSADAIALSVAAAPTNGNCGKFSVASGTVQVADAGYSCTQVDQYAKLGSTSCTTGASSYSTCTSTVSWPVSFADTTYFVQCMGIGPSDGRAAIQGVSTINVGSVVVVVVTEGSVAINYSDIHCHGHHN